MRVTRYLILAVSLLSIVVPAVADDAMTAWQSFVEVTPPAGAQGLSSCTLTAEVLESARDDLADLRLFDSNGHEIPFAVRVRRDVDESRLMETHEFNRAKAGIGISELAVDLGEDAGEHNEVEVSTEGQNFRRRVQLDGSDDGRNWRVLRSGDIIFSFEANAKRAESNRISYPVSRYRYLRAQVFSDSLVDRDAPQITGISVMMAVREKGESVSWDVNVPMAQFARAEGSPASAWLIDLGQRVPCDHISLDVINESFSRPFSLETADDPQNISLVTSGEIKRRAGEDRKPVVIGFDEVYARRLRLIVTDFANTPLSFSSIGASASARQVLFENKGSVKLPLRMFVGNSKAAAPRYDFENELPARLSVEPLTCEIGSLQPNPDYRPEPKPLTERVPWLIYAVLAVSSIALGFILMSLVRATRRNGRTSQRVEAPVPQSD